MIIGYINHLPEITNDEQKLKLTRCGKIFTDRKGKKDQLKRLLEELRNEDTLLFYTIHVFPTSTLELINLIDTLNQKKVKIESATENLQNQSLFSILADFQKEFRREASKPGVEGMRKRGTKGGRKKGLSEEAKTKAFAAAELYNAKKLTILEIMKILGIGSKTTLYKYLEFAGIKVKKFTKSK